MVGHKLIHALLGKQAAALAAVCALALVLVGLTLPAAHAGHPATAGHEIAAFAADPDGGHCHCSPSAPCAGPCAGAHVHSCCGALPVTHIRVRPDRQEVYAARLAAGLPSLLGGPDPRPPLPLVA